MRVDEDYEFPEEEVYAVAPEGKTIAIESYGPLYSGRYYKIFEEGYDWFRINYRGRPLYAPKWVFEK